MSNDKFDPILISLIRTMVPSIIADDIISAQPMSSPFSLEEWPYQADALSIASYTDVILMKQWCSETLNEGEWTSKVQYFAFKTAEAFTWFKLRWS